MSRIGNKPIKLAPEVTVTINDTLVMVKGPKGELSVVVPAGISVAQTEQSLVVSRADDERQTRAFHGLVRSLLNNSVKGVTKGYEKTLKLIGTGYRVAAKGQGISLSVGYSHPVDFKAPTGITLTVEGNDTIFVRGIDRQLVGQVSANIRKVRPPEPYKGKGIRYEDEIVRRKAGKTAAK